MISSFPNGPDTAIVNAVTDDFDDSEEWEHVQTLSEQETAAVIEMAALALDGRGDEAFERAMEMSLALLPTTLTVGAMMISSLAEMVADYEGRSPEQVLLELRLWYENEDNQGDT